MSQENDDNDETVHGGPVNWSPLSQAIFEATMEEDPKKRKMVAVLEATMDEKPREVLTDAERATIAQAVEARVNDYVGAARRLDLEWFRGFWANTEDFVIAADGSLMDYPTWDQQLEKDLATIREMPQFEFFDGHTYVLARDAAVHTTRFRWALVGTTGDTIRMHGSWSYVFKSLDGTWKVVHSAGTHLPQ